MSYTADTEKTERELNGIFRLFFDTEPLSLQNVNTSHGKEDFRYDYKRELSNIFRTLKTISQYYRFSICKNSLYFTQRRRMKFQKVSEFAKQITTGFRNRAE